MCLNSYKMIFLFLIVFVFLFLPFFNLIVDFPLHLNLPRVNPLEFNIVLVQMPIDRASFVLSTFFLHMLVINSCVTPPPPPPLSATNGLSGQGVNSGLDWLVGECMNRFFFFFFDCTILLRGHAFVTD